MIPLLLQIDPIFGWTGISTRFPDSWKWTPGEVAEHIENVAEKAIAWAKAWQKRHPKRFKNSK